MSSSDQMYKKWNILTVSVIVTGIVFLGIAVFIIDPYWHFHGPIEGVSYRLGNGRYMNDGILRNYEYDAVIIGTSMCENFKTSQWDELSGNITVKVPFFGASYKELHDTLIRAFSYNDEIKTIIWGIDYNQLNTQWDNMKYSDYPYYLYDDNFINDGNYLWNKTVLLRGMLPDLAYTIMGKASMGFDEYNSWSEKSGRDAVLKSYQPAEGDGQQKVLSEEQKIQIEENVKRNICDLIETHPKTEFYFFFTPYSIAYWDQLYYSGNLKSQIEATYIFAEQLLKYDNVKLFCFFNDYEMICNLNNYVDAGHYTGAINDRILQWMAGEQYLLTRENYQETIAGIEKFYVDFDYPEYWMDILEDGEDTKQ